MDDFLLYRPVCQNIDHFFNEIGKTVDHSVNRYENCEKLGDFNKEEKQVEVIKTVSFQKISVSSNGYPAWLK